MQRVLRGRRSKPVGWVIVADGPIGRHEWLNVAVATPALRLARGGAADQQVFAFRGGAPTLAWVDGRVVVTGASADDRADLEGLAGLLGARLEPSG